MRFLTAPKVHDGQKFLKPGTVLVLDDKDNFEKLAESSSLDKGKIETYDGVICPGFVNAHCHLELSHLKDAIASKTGLIDFAKGIIGKRNTFSPAHIKEAIEEQDKVMWENGIVAVGDICNTKDTFEKKSKSKIYYHSFIELIGLHPVYAEVILGVGKQLQDEAKRLNLKGSLVPHAPYSVSPLLMQKISETVSAGTPISIHNQESREEDKFFMQKEGGFVELYDFLKFPIDFFQPSGKSSLQTYLKDLPSKLILVHNTFSSKEDIRFANHLHTNLKWCLCPNANLYIENTLPGVKLMMEENCRICIGTDSLASNTELSIVSELNILLGSGIEMETLLKWATFNGAEALSVKEDFGGFIPGKNSGINLIAQKENKVSFEKKLA